MHPAIGYQLAFTQIAAQRRQAHRDHVARAAIRARRGP